MDVSDLWHGTVNDWGSRVGARRPNGGSVVGLATAPPPQFAASGAPPRRSTGLARCEDLVDVSLARPPAP